MSSGRKRDAAGTREEILRAARRRFLHDGYAATTTRRVAGDVGVDPALISRYFGSKLALWKEATRTDLDLPSFAHVDADDVGIAIIRAFLDRWDGESGEALAVLLAASTTNDEAANLVRSVFADQVQEAVGAVAPDRRAERAETVVSLLLGLALTRYILRLPGTAAHSRQAIESIYAPLVRHALTEAV